MSTVLTVAPVVRTFFRVKGTHYLTEVEAQVMAAGRGEWGSDETIDKVQILEWGGKFYTESWPVRIEAAAPELVRLYQQVGRDEFVKLADQMRRP